MQQTTLLRYQRTSRTGMNGISPNPFGFFIGPPLTGKRLHIPRPPDEFDTCLLCHCAPMDGETLCPDCTARMIGLSVDDPDGHARLRKKILGIHEARIDARSLRLAGSPAGRGHTW